jgi:hypothetical protein
MRNQRRISMSLLRKCNRCGLEAHTEEDLELFVKTSGRMKYGRRNECKKCKEEVRKENDTQEKRDKKMEWYVQKEYGVSLKEYRELIATSDCCEICGRVDGLVYDHDHDMKGVEAFRGVVCHQCNRALGLLGDRLQDVENALEYMRRFYDDR